MTELIQNILIKRKEDIIIMKANYVRKKISVLPNVEVLTIGVNSTCSIDSGHELYNYGVYFNMYRSLNNLENYEIFALYIDALKKTICLYRNDDKEHLEKSVTSIMEFCKDNNFKHVAFDEHELKMYNFDSIFEKYDDIEVDITIEK